MMASLSIASAIASRTRLSARVGFMVSRRMKIVSTVGPPLHCGAALHWSWLTQRPQSASPRWTIAVRTSRSARKHEGDVLDRGGAAGVGGGVAPPVRVGRQLDVLALDPLHELVRAGPDRLERVLVRVRLARLRRVERREVEPGRQDRVRGRGDEVEHVLADRLRLELRAR